MSHRFVERDVFEDLDDPWIRLLNRERSYLDPGEKDNEGDDVVELGLPVGEKFEIGELLLTGEKLVQDLGNFQLTVDVEYDANVGYHDDHHVQHVPHGREVLKSESGDLDGHHTLPTEHFPPPFAYFNDFLHGVVDGEENEEDFAGEDEIIHRGDVLKRASPLSARESLRRTYANQFHGGELLRRYGSARRRKFDDQFNLTEQIDVGIVNGEVEKRHTCSAIQPEIPMQTVQLSFGAIMIGLKGLHEPAGFVTRDETVGRRPTQLCR